MDKFTEEKNTLMLISLMKVHGIRKVVVSPGTTNVSLVASFQADPYFELYSSVDERSAGYIACGLAVESGEPVALSCTQATASRNYLPALTEAFYRKISILAITSTQHLGRVGQNIQQAIDRSSYPTDALKLSVHVPVIYNDDDEWHCNVMLNRALLELRRAGGGPVHINLTTTYSKVFNVSELPLFRVINRVDYTNELPEIPQKSRVAIYVGSHKIWSNELRSAVNNFCKVYDAVVLCDQTSNYNGKYRINPNLLLSQGNYVSPAANLDILIHIGDVSGGTTRINMKEVWRVNPDGEIRDTFRKQRYVFEMEESFFFTRYAALGEERTHHESFLNEWLTECDKVTKKIPEIPFSNAWLALTTLHLLPENSVLHLGIYNSLRTWSLCEAPKSVLSYSNTGGFGIDGGLSSFIGASLYTDKHYFCVIGDLAFFYDMNSLGNRHVGNNLRILLVNNGCGTEFKGHINRAYSLAEDADPYIAAMGHYGNKSRTLVKHYAEDLGFEYISATNKEEYLEHLHYFISSEKRECSLLFEVFIDNRDETEALKLMHNIEISTIGVAKAVAKTLLGDKGVKTLKKILK